MSKRELVDTGSDKGYTLRQQRGGVTESTDVGRSLARAMAGQGGQGNRST